MVRGIVQAKGAACVQSPECKLERTGVHSEGEADSPKDFSRNVVRAGSRFWKILLVPAGG